MDETVALEIALFRYGVIAQLLTREMGRGEQARLLREAASRRYEIPCSQKHTIGLRTLERWLGAYREQGLERHPGCLPVTQHLAIGPIAVLS